MSTLNVDKDEARKVLYTALDTPCTVDDEITKKIRFVLNGTHKTYKYVLVTGILAKATNPGINSLCLQAGAPLEGAYDARSVCHEVLVPFERDVLSNALGGSNEPFLNKPARFTHLSTQNAVRRGNDTETLLTLLKIFETITDHKSAAEYLSCCIKVIQERMEALGKLTTVSISQDLTLVDVQKFFRTLITKSFEGETCAIVVGTLTKLFYSSVENEFTVKAHKVNQSGASSKEIGDIDIFKGDSFFFRY